MTYLHLNTFSVCRQLTKNVLNSRIIRGVSCMDYDVFISFSTEDIDKVNEIREILESHGIKCWFAPEAIRGIEDFRKIIPPAICGSKAFLLLLSDKAQESKWVERELNCADENDVPVLVYFINDCKIKEHFGFVTSTVNRYEMKGEDAERINRLRKDLKELFDIGDYDIAVDEDYAKKNVAADTGGTAEKINKINSSKSKKKIFGIVGGVLLAVILAVTLFFVFSGKDGDYVIYAPEFNIALSGDVAKNNHYHKGEEISVKNGKVTDYSKKCVWELDFDKDGTFTISRNGKMLGIEPGYNGIGLGDEYSAKRWELVETKDGIRIRNTETKYWLEWYPEKDNWTTHYEIIEGKDDQFLIELYKVK